MSTLDPVSQQYHRTLPNSKVQVGNKSTWARVNSTGIRRMFKHVTK